MNIVQGNLYHKGSNPLKMMIRDIRPGMIAEVCFRKNQDSFSIEHGVVSLAEEQDCLTVNGTAFLYGCRNLTQEVRDNVDWIKIVHINGPEDSLVVKTEDGQLWGQATQDAWYPLMGNGSYKTFGYLKSLGEVEVVLDRIGSPA